MKNKDFKHGTIKIGFTVDEKVGRESIILTLNALPPTMHIP